MTLVRLLFLWYTQTISDGDPVGTNTRLYIKKISFLSFTGIGCTRFLLFYGLKSEIKRICAQGRAENSESKMSGCSGLIYIFSLCEKSSSEEYTGGQGGEPVCHSLRFSP